MSYGGPCISHLLFANDSLLFCIADIEEPGWILQILRSYEIASGQTINLDNSRLFFWPHTSTQKKLLEFLRNKII